MPAFARLTAHLDHHMLDLHILLERVYRHIFTNTTLFVATMWHLRGQWQMVVDPDRTELENSAGMHRLVDVFGPDRSRQAVDNAVGVLQDLFFGLEATDNDDRAEYFALHNLRILAVLSNHRWLEEETLLETRDSGSLATSENIRTSAQSTLDVALYAVAL